VPVGSGDTNELHPYPEDLQIVTKVGAVRGSDGSWLPQLSRQGLIDAVHSNIEHLGVAALDVVNLRVGGVDTPTDDPLGSRSVCWPSCNSRV
jgi:aryl-alcohol dehydrogenase-like predicted oxidoreductase